ncbi:SO_0444 family Cu/Zn efflux transporter [Marinomonas aquiplantarum]|uniref:Permease n=1 Tax=Marinomonas aquiplantarum TaxID=491951 RepID=A0A366D1T3_9GAMM|nr:SO_0444 family Cu/Zn efflux transporter [Marinomonas aquiplantarum]RBO83459.1 hypothetical protein DFP76_104278 [Marinomonas aquiplantarum]
MLFLSHFYQLFLESAPWFIFGLALAGIMKTCIPINWMNQQLGGHDIKTTVKAAFIGAPLPLCSCGVIPAAMGLRRAGASKAATSSFLVSTPETGIDSISVSYVMLGPFMALVRPIAAIFSAILAGLFVNSLDNQSKSSYSVDDKPTDNTSSCCASSNSIMPKSAHNTAANSSKDKNTSNSCCSINKKQQNNVAPNSCCSTQKSNRMNNAAQKIQKGLRFSATNLVDDISMWLIIGIGFAALVQAYLPSGFLAQWGDGILAMLIMVIISIPMYICATASTPIAAGLLLAGVSPGAVLVFMMAGPATNIATLGVIGKEMGKKTLLGYLIGVIGGALMCGYLINFLAAQFHIEIQPQIGPEHALLPYWLVLSSATLLAFLIGLSFIKKAKNTLK